MITLSVLKNVLDLNKSLLRDSVKRRLRITARVENYACSHALVHSTLQASAGTLQSHAE